MRAGEIMRWGMISSCLWIEVAGTVKVEAPGLPAHMRVGESWGSMTYVVRESGVKSASGSPAGGMLGRVSG